MIRKAIIFTSLTWLLLLGLTQSAMAQDFEELGLAIRPAILEITGEPGQTVTTNILIENISASVTGVSIGSRSLIPNDPEIDQQRRGDFDASQWIEPVETALLLERGQSREIPIEVRIPENAGPGGHYSLITLRAANATSQQTDSNTSVANPELTSVLFVTVPGLVDEQASLALEQPTRIQLNQPIPVSAQLSNTGNIHVLASTEITVKNARNDEAVATIRIPGEVALPNTVKELSQTWDPDGKVGSFYFEILSTYGSPQQEILLITESFWVLPPLTTLILAASIILFTIFSIATGKHWPRAILRIAGAPLRFVTDRSEVKDEKVSTDALDELSLDRTLADTAKTRDIEKKQPRQNKITDVTNRSSQRNYIESLSKKKKNKK